MLQATWYLICTSLLCSNDPALCSHVSLNVAAPRPETAVDRTRPRICSCLPFCGSTPNGRLLGGKTALYGHLSSSLSPVGRGENHISRIFVDTFAGTGLVSLKISFPKDVC